MNRSPGDYRELLSDPAIDAVHICTPDHLHLPMAKAAMETGKTGITAEQLPSAALSGRQSRETGPRAVYATA